MDPSRRAAPGEGDDPDESSVSPVEATGEQRRRASGFQTSRILIVDDEPDAADLAATYLERLLTDIETATVTSADAAIDHLDLEPVDCIVSDYDMPGRNGLKLLREVRETEGEIPFILFTGKGSEEIASEAISAGVTDYLQKRVGPDQYEVLANRVANALQQRHAEIELTETNRKVTAIHDFVTELSSAESVEEVFERVVDASEEILEFDRSMTARREGDVIVPAVRSASVTPDDVRTFKLGEGALGRTVAEERTFVIDDLDADEASEGASAADPVSDDFRSAISVPIGSYGGFQAVSAGYGEFDDRDVEFAELVCSHARDAIERIRTEAELRAGRDRLAALFENVPLPIARIVIDQAGDRRFDATNDAFEETFGAAAGEDSYRETFDRIVPEGTERVHPTEVAEGEEPVRAEVKRRTVDGSREFLVHVIPTLRREGALVYAMYADIDEQKRIERTLRGLHEVTRRMFLEEDRTGVAHVATRAAVDIIDFPNSGVRLYDPSTEALKPTAISREATAAIGERPPFGPGDGLIWDAFEGDELAVVSDLDAVETAIGYGALRSLVVVPLGTHGVLLLGSEEPSYFDETDVQLARLLGANVTVALDRAEQIERLRERDSALKREVERLESFTGIVSHDLRNPLNVATGRLAIAQDRIDDPDTIHHLDQVADAHGRMAGLIDDLLTLAREGRAVDTLERVWLDEVTAAAWATVPTHDATLHTETADAVVRADPERVRTLFENLFRNAVEHAGDDVTVTVSASEDGFVVADDGPGFEMDPERAMEHGVSSRTRGTGFGLAIVHQIVTAHGWELSVENDDGARFTVLTG
ncbi:GAF domain-containing protein [Halorubrum vacuolatum]|uniref:histidine kinase n=1 Tax=Halorubrum vacuolatum TaxID=63740 RepID=A0A238VBG5_HALVU|nr:GAF domain-containing protein [Halorubrum vacuolatum]SNR30879.1 PAS domain S-box-containing protein [Halorubrum vacuolatum]